MISEIVCPEFYVDEWLKMTPQYTEAKGTEFELSADDGVCRLLKSERDEFGGTVLICRCGMRFKPVDGKHVELAK
jgi:hypothetical protein